MALSRVNQTNPFGLSLSKPVLSLAEGPCRTAGTQALRQAPGERQESE